MLPHETSDLDTKPTHLHGSRASDLTNQGRGGQFLPGTWCTLINGYRQEAERMMAELVAERNEGERGLRRYQLGEITLDRLLGIAARLSSFKTKRGHFAKRRLY